LSTVRRLEFSLEESVVFRVAIAIIALVIVGTVAVSPARAQTEIDAEVPDADYGFGQHITFHLRATSPTTITEVNLFFRVGGQSDTVAVSVPIDPGAKIAVDFPYSTAGQELPPFAIITYRWDIHDESGLQQQTEEKLLYYADNRYAWRSVADQQRGISWEVYWVQGDVVFGQTALNVAVKALDDIYRELKVSVPGVIRIFIYPSEEDLRSALNLAGYEWAGGQARPELGVILVGIPEGRAAPGEMERLIPHELTHLLVYEAAGRKTAAVPPWLNEGLASLNERRPDPNRQALVDQALTQDRLFPLEALCAPFPAEENAARLAYAQSASVVHFLREEYGSPVIRDLLAAYADNASCEAGVTRVLGKSLEGLDTAWRAHLTSQGQVITALNDSVPWLALLVLTALLALPFLGVVRNPKDNP
jgi:hypothetical protein